MLAVISPGIIALTLNWFDVATAFPLIGAEFKVGLGPLSYLGPMAGEVGLAGQGGPAEDGGEFCCLGSLAFPFGLDGREH